MDPYGDFPWRSVKLLGDEYYMLARFSFPTVMRYNPIELSAGLIMGNEATIIWSLKFRLIIHSLVLYSGWYHLSFSCTCFIAPFVSILSASSKVKKLLGGPMYAHASQWLRNSGFGLPQKNTTFSHVTPSHGAQKQHAISKQEHHLPTLCLMSVATPICRRIQRSKNPTSRAFTSSNTSLVRGSCIKVAPNWWGILVTICSTERETPISGCVVILHGLSHPVFWICFATEFFGFMLDNLMVRIGFKRQFSAHHISKGNSQPVELLSHFNST